MSQQWNPLQDLVMLQDRMNRLFEDATQRRNQSDAAAGDEFERADWTPASDIYETDSGYMIAMDLPGIDREALKIDIDDNRLVREALTAMLHTLDDVRVVATPAGDSGALREAKPQILLLDAGHVRARGTHAALLATVPDYRDAWERERATD